MLMTTYAVGELSALNGVMGAKAERPKVPRSPADIWCEPSPVKSTVRRERSAIAIPELNQTFYEPARASFTMRRASWIMLYRWAWSLKLSA